jgi:cytosine/uracil/thiamine/allantoin permease
MNHLKLIRLSFLLFLMTTLLSSCELVKGIFKAGVWTGVIIVVAIIALVMYLVSRGRK